MEEASYQISLKQYVDLRFEGHMNEHKALDKALEKAEENIAQASKNFITIGSVEEKVRPLYQFMDRFWGVIIGLTILNALITALVVVVLKKQ